MMTSSFNTKTVLSLANVYVFKFRFNVRRFWCGLVKVLDAVSLEERFKTALPMLTRQIEGLKLLKKSKNWIPGSEKKVAECFPFLTFISQLDLLMC